MLSPALAKRLNKMVEDSLDSPIRIRELAEQVGLSRAHFSPALPRSFGITPQAYIMSGRIARAARARSISTDTDLAATQIAMRCGFANPSHLTSAFRQELGITSTDNRRALTQS